MPKAPKRSCRHRRATDTKQKQAVPLAGHGLFFAKMLLLFSQILQILNLHLFKFIKIWYSKSKSGMNPVFE